MSAAESFNHDVNAHQPKGVANGSFFENVESASTEQSGIQEVFGQHQLPAFAPSATVRPPSAKPDNVELFQPTVDSTLAAPSRSTPNVVPSAEVFYPENRERLDDVSTPQSTSSTSVTDRHNYLVTGQLSQERMAWPQQQPYNQTQFEGNRNVSEELPPRGLSRMVVGQPESNHDQVVVPDILPPFNRMVTGTETIPSNYINYQRQADGEVSQASPVIPRPQSNSPFTHNLHQNIPEVVQQSFNTTDRNLYLVAGESDVNDHRVIPGVESNVPASILNPMQNLHIQEEDGFVNVSVPVQERNVNVDGMETAPDPQQQRPIDTASREEDIDGANDNTESFNPTSVIPVHEHGLARTVSNEMESDVREEAIEGANDYNDDIRRSADDSKNKLDKSLKSRSVLSSEDSELRDLEINKMKPRPRRLKKYADDTNESENEYSDSDKREKYRRPAREKMSREEYENYRRREKERRSDERPRKGDDTDGSKYGESKRRTDDEDDYRRTRDKYKKGSRRHPEDEDVDKEKKIRDKYREGGSRRSK